MELKKIILTIAVLCCIGLVALYYTFPRYVVYAVSKTTEGVVWKEKYNSFSHDRAKEQYKYWNNHKEDGVLYYLFYDEEYSNSVIP